MMKPKVLIGLHGKARSGKDTVGDYLCRLDSYGTLQFQNCAFADPLKESASAMFGIDLDDFYNEDVKELPNNFWGISPREITQKLGTECGREIFFSDLWIRRAKLSINEIMATHPENTGVVVTDVRFDDEADFVRDNGGTMIIITRNTESYNVREHKSEKGITIDPTRDFIIANDGTLKALYNAVDIIVNTLINGQK